MRFLITTPWTLTSSSTSSMISLPQSQALSPGSGHSQFQRRTTLTVRMKRKQLDRLPRRLGEPRRMYHKGHGRKRTSATLHCLTLPTLPLMLLGHPSSTSRTCSLRPSWRISYTKQTSMPCRKTSTPPSR